MRVLIISGRPGRAAHYIALLARSVDLVIAADGGAETAARAGIRPHVLVGDMDSATLETRRRLVRAGTRLHVVPSAKDLTDTELALALARDRGATDATVVAALGGRVDHSLANLLLPLRAKRWGIRLRVVEGRTHVHLAGTSLMLEGEPGDVVSLIPLSEVVLDITTTGLRYPLKNDRLVRGGTRGLSNVIVDLPAGLEHVGKGDLLVVHIQQHLPR